METVLENAQENEQGKIENGQDRMPFAEPQSRRWTRAEYYQLAEQGLFHGQHVQLIEGEIVDMSPRYPPHSAAVALGVAALHAAFGNGFWVRSQEPLNLGTTSDPEPDIAVVPGSPRNYTDHPTTALLVVEVSDSSLAYDRRRKASLYARAGITDFWIVNLVDRQLEIYRNPVPDTTQPSGFRYQDVIILRGPASATPLAAPQAQVPLADLLP